MIKLKYDSKGSTLIILLLTISVIVLIGSVVLSLAVVNFKMKKTNSSVKQNFYLAEAGLDESYIITKEFVDRAVNYALSKVEEYNELDDQTSMYKSDNLYSMTDEITDERKNIIFSSAFKNFIKGNCTDISPNYSLIKVLKDFESYVVYQNGYPKISPSITEHTDFFQIDVKSTYTTKSIKNELMIKLKITIPKYNDLIISDEFESKDLIKIVEWNKER